MAMTGVLRPGYIQIRVLDMDAALTHYVDRVGLNMVSRGNDGRVYLKGWDEFDRHSIILRPADTPGMDFAGFKVAAEHDLDVFRKRIGDAGISVEVIAEGDLPGTGRRLGFMIPSGHRLELYAEMELSPDAPSTRPPISGWRIHAACVRADSIIFSSMALISMLLPASLWGFSTFL
jgi:catechol 2,3-dioxygenase